MAEEGKGSRGDDSKRGGRAKGGAAKGKQKPRRKRQSTRGATQKARERAAGLVPNPNFKLIASDPLKAQIVAIALQRPYSPSEYAKEAGVELNVASYAFKVLKDRGVLELVDLVSVRGTVKHMYRATEEALVSSADWGELSEALRPVFTGTILQDFSSRVTQAIETGHLFSRDDFCLYWAPRDMDEIAWEEQVEIYNWCIEESERLEMTRSVAGPTGKATATFTRRLPWPSSPHRPAASSRSTRQRPSEKARPNRRANNDVLHPRPEKPKARALLGPRERAKEKRHECIAKASIDRARRAPRHPPVSRRGLWA